MPVMMRVKAREGLTIHDPHSGRKVPTNRFVDVRLSSVTARMLNQGVLVQEEEPAQPKPEPARKARKDDKEASES